MAENIVGTRIREERKRRGMSLDDLASAVGLSNRSQAQRIETGERKVDSLLLRRISQALDVPMDAFFDEERGQVLALARAGGDDAAGMQRMQDWGLELLADIEFADHEVQGHGW